MRVVTAAGIALLLAFAPSGCAPPPAGPPAPSAAPAPEVAPPPHEVVTPSDDEIRWLIRSTQKFCGLDDVAPYRQALAKLGTRAFPVYHAVLADPTSSDLMVHRTYDAILAVAGADRRRFVPLAVMRFTAKDGMYVLAERYRWTAALERTPEERAHAVYLLAQDHARARAQAIEFLGAIGDGRDAPALVPLLADDADYVRYAAADALARIGGHRELAAIDKCLKADDPRRDDDETRFLTERRDALAKRLAAGEVGGD